MVDAVPETVRLPSVVMFVLMVDVAFTIDTTRNTDAVTANVIATMPSFLNIERSCIQTTKLLTNN